MTENTRGAALSDDYEPARRNEAGRSPAVPGTVRLMTDEPLEVTAPLGPPGLRERLTRQLEQRPWLLPAALLSVIALILIGRRR